MYGKGRSEEVLGLVLRDFGKRDETVIATKVYFPMRSDVNGRGLSRKAIMTEIHHSLRRLRTDYVDLSDAEIEALEASYVPHRIAGFE
jgi:aryl-alcohol dehydrogenase-like predicted oxidoreductase